MQGQLAALAFHQALLQGAHTGQCLLLLSAGLLQRLAGLTGALLQRAQCRRPTGHLTGRAAALRHPRAQGLQ